MSGLPDTGAPIRFRAGRAVVATPAQEDPRPPACPRTVRAAPIRSRADPAVECRTRAARPGRAHAGVGSAGNPSSSRQDQEALSAARSPGRRMGHLGARAPRPLCGRQRRTPVGLLVRIATGRGDRTSHGPSRLLIAGDGSPRKLLPTRTWEDPKHAEEAVARPVGFLGIV